MSLPFDATLKDLAREHPRAFLSLFDHPTPGPLSLLNVDLSTVTTGTDFAVGLGQPLQEIMHIDFQSSASARKHRDILAYNALPFSHRQVPVHSIVVLLRPQAAHSNLNGTVTYAPRSLRGKMEFTYEVVRLWELPAGQILTGDLGTVPLATLGRLDPNVSVKDGLAAVISQLVQRVLHDAAPDEAKKLITASFLLTGLRVPRPVAKTLFKGVQAMRDSDTYLAIIDEGQEKALKGVILRLGQKRFGPPSEAIRAQLEALNEDVEPEDIERLERLTDRILDVNSWEELFEEPR